VTQASNAMAGLVFELLRTEETDSEALPVTILPGISALNAAASLLGAPQMHDSAQFRSLTA
jgi:precorrin-3B methylase